MRFSPVFLEDLRERVRLAPLVSQRATPDRKKSVPARGEFWYCCPFHGEKSASFHVSETKGRYHCFGCGVSGDVFSWLIETSGLSFTEAVERVAETAGVPLPQITPEATKREARKLTLAGANEIASKFFEAQLWGPAGEEARAYLTRRGVSADLARRFRLGFAPDSRSALKEHLTKEGIDHERMIEAGLLMAGPDIPVSYDRFRGRLMFPILDDKGRPIAFGGRTLGDAKPKYLNSPETDLFHKGSTLYHRGPAREAAHKSGELVIVEGYMDVIALAGGGIVETVAPLGTAMGEDQLRLAWRMAPEPIVCFDADDPGQKAMKRLADLALPLVGPGRSLRFATLPPTHDPDSLVRRRGIDGFRVLMTNAAPLSDVIWRSLTADRDVTTPERRAGLDAAVREVLVRIEDPDTRRAYRKTFDERLFSMNRPRSVVRSNGHSNHSASPSAIRLTHAYAPDPARLNLKEACLVAAMVSAPEAASNFAEGIVLSPALSRESVGAVSAISEALAGLSQPDHSALMAALGPDMREVVETAFATCRSAGLSSILPGGSATAAEAVLRNSARH